MTKLIKKTPPPIARGRVRNHALTEWNALLAKAVAHPHVWYVIDPPYENPSTASSTAHDIRSGRNQSLPSGRWDAMARGCELFVMYLGD